MSLFNVEALSEGLSVHFLEHVKLRTVPKRARSNAKSFTNDATLAASLNGLCEQKMEMRNTSIR